MRSIVLHVGAHKTGTTTIQKRMDRNSNVFGQHEAYYFSLSEMRAMVTPVIISAQPRRLKALRRTMDGLPFRTFVLSDENIIGNSRDIFRGSLYPMAAMRLEQFVNVFDKYNFFIIICIRRPSDFIVSMYSEYLRHNDFIDFDRFVKSFKIEKFNWRNVIWWAFPGNRISGVNYRLLPFEDELGGGVSLVLSTIAQCAGLEADARRDLLAQPLSRGRVGFGAEEIALANRISDVAGANTARSFLRMIESEGRRFATTRLTPIDEATANHIDGKYHDLVKGMI